MHPLLKDIDTWLLYLTHPEWPSPRLDIYVLDEVVAVLAALSTLTCLVTVLWPLRAGTPTRPLRRSALLLILWPLLTLAPAYTYLSSFRQVPLLVSPLELWGVLLWGREYLSSTVVQHRLAATFFLVLFVGGGWLLLAGRRAPRWAAVLLCMVGIWPLGYTARAALWHLDTLQSFRQGQALYLTACQEAGPQVIHRVAPEDGITLARMRLATVDAEWASPLQVDAGMPGQWGGERYIRSFLDFSFNDMDITDPRFTSSRWGKTTLHGFRHVDVRQPDGSYLRHRLEGQADSALLTEPVTAAQAARYEVDHEAMVRPQERALWVARATVSVRDRASGQVIGQLKTAAFAPPPRTLDQGRDQRRWDELGHSTCPLYQDIPGAQPRLFVGEVVPPR